MTAVQFNNHKINLCDFPKVDLDDIDERCGEVFITFDGTLVFHCSLCTNNYGGIDNFLDHLATHYKDVQKEEEKEENEESDNDVKTGRRYSEMLFEDYDTDRLCQAQEFVNDVDVNDDDVNVKADDVNVHDDINIKYDVHVNDNINVKYDVHVNNDLKEYGEMLQIKDAVGMGRINFEHIDADSKESNVEHIKDEIEIEEQSLSAFNLEENTTESIPKRQYHKTVGRFTCKECGKRCRTKLSLKRHSVIHSDERRYKCKICGAAFKDRANCYAHVRRIHLGTNKIECGYCPKTFFTRSEVRSHRRTHTGERPYVCTTCGKTFTDRGRLNTHNKYHTSEPTYKCNYCEKAFYERPRYDNHLLVHTKEKHFVCEICAASFPRHTSLVRHSKLHEKPTK